VPPPPPPPLLDVDVDPQRLAVHLQADERRAAGDRAREHHHPPRQVLGHVGAHFGAVVFVARADAVLEAQLLQPVPLLSCDERIEVDLEPDLLLAAGALAAHADRQRRLVSALHLRRDHVRLRGVGEDL
jgi:hypothetical protein